MARTKKSAPKAPKAAKTQPQPEPSAEFLPKKDLFRIDEAAAYFGVTDKTIRLWIDHGRLQAEQVVGCVRIPRESILSLRIIKNMEMR